MSRRLRSDLERLERNTAEHLEDLFQRMDERLPERRIELIDQHIRHALAVAIRPRLIDADDV
jgi:hypothetical protein